MSRYGFTLRTRGGQRVENIMIIAASRDEAERRLRQMYPDCSIVECRTHTVPSRLVPRSDDAIVNVANAPYAQRASKPGSH